MSVKTALAKLAAAAAGGALLGGGAVHVAEPQSADVTTFKSTKAPVKYTKGPARRVVLKTPTPKKVKRIRRVIEDQPECEEDCKPRMAMVPIPLPQAPAPLPAAFLGYVLSERAQALIAEEGFLPLAPAEREAETQLIRATMTP